MAKKIEINGTTALKIRHKLGQSQDVFWRGLGATQAAGSRYESGRSIPTPTKRLLYLTHIAKAITPAMQKTLDGIK